MMKSSGIMNMDMMKVLHRKHNIMKYKINNNSFKNKGEITEFFQSILYKNKGRKLTNEDFQNVLALLYFHPNYEKKKGTGIVEVRVEYHNDFHTGGKSKNPHFQIYRKDGTNIDFSFYTCIKHIKKDGKVSESLNVLKDFKDVMRFEIRDQIISFRKKAFTNRKYIQCPILGINCSNKTSHVDHAPPLMFDRILYNFVKENNVDYRKIKYQNINGIFAMLLDRELANRWKSYHKDNAHLRITHRAGNLSQKRTKNIF